MIYLPFYSARGLQLRALEAASGARGIDLGLRLSASRDQLLERPTGARGIDGSSVFLSSIRIPCFISRTRAGALSWPKY